MSSLRSCFYRFKISLQGYGIFMKNYNKFKIITRMVQNKQFWWILNFFTKNNYLVLTFLNKISIQLVKEQKKLISSMCSDMIFQEKRRIFQFSLRKSKIFLSFPNSLDHISGTLHFHSSNELHEIIFANSTISVFFETLPFQYIKRVCHESVIIWQAAFGKWKSKNIKI